MTAEQLIEVLKTMPKDAQVWHLWDGELRTKVEVVYLSRSGKVVTADYDEVCYTGKSRPLDAPDESENKYWSTEKNPNKHYYGEDRD